MAYADTVVSRIAGLIEAYLGASAVESVQMYPPTLGPPAARFPALTVYRRSEAIVGQTPKRRYRADIVVRYTLGLMPGHKAEEAWGSLQAVVETIDRACLYRRHASYEHGASLESLVNILHMEVTDAQFEAMIPTGPEEAAFPAVECTLIVLHTATNAPTTEELDGINVSTRDVHQSEDADHQGLTVDTEYEEPPGP